MAKEKLPSALAARMEREQKDRSFQNLSFPDDQTIRRHGVGSPDPV